MIARRFFATSVRVAVADRIATLSLARAPANLLSLEFMNELTESLKTVESDRGVSGLIVTSAQPGIFSGGLDISELYQPTPERLTAFWRALQDLWLTFYGLKTPAVAAINGAAPAGGCMLALCCDERIMLSSARIIGLNETKLGIVAPPNIFEIPFRAVVGARQSERLLQLGKLLSPAEALQVGLVDAVVDSEQALLERAHATLKEYIAVPAGARVRSKLIARGAAIEKLQRERATDLTNIPAIIGEPSVQKNIGLYLESLKKPKVAAK
jgi:3,2-trans-enoyl-CoA isomerase